MLLFLAVAILATLAAVCVVAIVSVMVGLALRSSRYEHLYPYFVWIPSLVVGFAASFTGYSVYATLHDWTFPAGPVEYFVALGMGEIMSVGLGVTLAARTRVTRKLEVKHAA